MFEKKDFFLKFAQYVVITKIEDGTTTHSSSFSYSSEGLQSGFTANSQNIRESC